MKAMYEVVYKDDFYNTHITFLSSWHDILFLMDRYGRENVTFYKTDYYPHNSTVSV